MHHDQFSNLTACYNFTGLLCINEILVENGMIAWQTWSLEAIVTVWIISMPLVHVVVGLRGRLDVEEWPRVADRPLLLRLAGPQRLWSLRTFCKIKGWKWIILQTVPFTKWLSSINSHHCYDLIFSCGHSGYASRPFLNLLFAKTENIFSYAKPPIVVWHYRTTQQKGVVTTKRNFIFFWSNIGHLHRCRQQSPAKLEQADHSNFYMSDWLNVSFLNSGNTEKAEIAWWQNVVKHQRRHGRA